MTTPFKKSKKKKHPAPSHLRAKAVLKANAPTDKKLNASEACLAGQAKADPGNKLGAEAAALATARATLVAKLVKKATITADANTNDADLVLAIDAHDQAIADYSRAAAKFAGLDVALLTALGCEAVIKQKKDPNQAIPAPTHLAISEGANHGQAGLKCSKVAGAGSYVFQYKLEPSKPEDPWLPDGGIQTKYVQATVDGLAPAQAIRGRVRAIGGVSSPWSAEVVGRAR